MEIVDSFYGFLNDEIGQILDSEEGAYNYLKIAYPDIVKELDKEDYKPKTLEDANNFLLHNILEIGNSDEIPGIYYDKNKEQHIVPIKKANFYNGYYYDIWKNLDIKERAQIIYWHVESKREQVNLKKINFSFMPDYEYAIEHNVDFGYYIIEDNKMYISYQLLKTNDCFDIIQTIEHEFEHVKQAKIFEFLKKQKNIKYNIFEKYILQSLYEVSNKYLQIYQKLPLYVGNPMEIKAEKRAFKQTSKYYELNTQTFGDNDKQRNKNLYNFKQELMLCNYLYTPTEVQKFIKKDSSKYKNYCYNRKVIQKMNNICKLVILKDNINTELQTKKASKVQDQKTKNEIKSLKLKIEKIDYYLISYIDKENPKKLFKNNLFKDLDLVDKSKEME